MSYLPDELVTVLCVHYSATPIERPYSYAALEAGHIKRGFRKGGYHYYIRRNGRVVTGRDMSQAGRFEVGAQSKGENSSSIGICFEGGVTAARPNVGFDSRTPAQTKAMIKLLHELQDRFPQSTVVGHRDMPEASTQCPGFDATAWWDGVLKAEHKVAISPVKRVLNRIFAALDRAA